MIDKSNSPQDGIPEIIDTEVVLNTLDHPVSDTRHLPVLQGLVGTEALPETIGLHEASGVQFDLGFDHDLIHKVSFYDVTGRVDWGYTEPCIYLPATAANPAPRLVEIDDFGALGRWFQRTIDDAYESDIPIFTALDKRETAEAEGLTPDLLVRLPNDDYNPRYTYNARANIGDVVNIEVYTSGPPVSDALRQEGGNRFADDDPVANHVMGEDRYIIRGHATELVVSRSTLALIDAVIQFQQQTGLETITLSTLIGLVYDPDNFEDPEQLKDGQKVAMVFMPSPESAFGTFQITGEDILRKIVTCWTTELEIDSEAPAALSLEDSWSLFDTIQSRNVSLTALAEEFGDVSTVRKVSTGISLHTASSLPQLLSEYAGQSGNALVEALPPEAKESIIHYAELLGHQVSLFVDRMEEYDDPVNTMLEKLVETGLVDADIAAVHRLELGSLVSEYLALAKAQQLMENSGVDSSAIDSAFDARLAEFVVKHYGNMQRTQQFAPEIGMNLDTVLTIIERTRLKGRTLPEITQVLGQIASAHEKAVNAVFPNLVQTIREEVQTELGVSLLSVPGDHCDRTGATLYVKTEEEARRIQSHLQAKLSPLSGTDNLILPVEVKADKVFLVSSTPTTFFSIAIGDSKHRTTIPKSSWLPKGPQTGFLRKTRN